MDKIYSRRRVKIFYPDKNKTKKKIIFILIFIIAITTAVTTINSTTPIFEDLCKDKAIEISTIILNEESSKVLQKYNYNDIVTVIKTDENKILKTDVKIINEMASMLALQVTNRLKDLKNENIKIPVGAFLGSKYFSGIGPGINISIIPTGNVTTQVKTEYKEQGINQTVYRIYLEVECNERILTSYKTLNTRITNQVLLTETIIVGDVPATYYNLEGLDKENAIDIVE